MSLDVSPVKILVVMLIIQHLSVHKILVESQQDFRSGSVHTGPASLSNGAHKGGHKQTELIIMDFAK